MRSARLFALAFAGLVAATSGTARAQQVKGRVLVLLDTSGSMGMHFADANPLAPPPAGDFPGGDGSTSYTDARVGAQFWFPGKLLGNGTRDGVNSRLYAAKSAITNAVNAFSGDVDFGLATYNFDFCPYNVPQCAGCYVAYCDANGCLPCGGNTGRACNRYDCLYADLPFQKMSAVNWSALGCSGTNPAARGGRIIALPGPGSAAQMLPWIDGVEVFESSNDGSTAFSAEPDCNSDADCPGGVVNGCRKLGCANDLQCPGALSGGCVNGTCTLGLCFSCQTDADCGGPGNTGQCKTGLCRAPCASNADCGGVRNSCVAGYCTNYISPRGPLPLGGTPVNPEMRASGDTPLAESIYTAQTQWFDKVKGQDPQISCRPYVLVVATDGGQSYECTTGVNGNAPGPGNPCCNGSLCNNGECGADPTVAVQNLYNDGKAAGNPVLTYVIGLSINAQQDIAQLNAMAAAGGTSQARFATDSASIQAAFADILSKSIKVELCNGVDDNCNGEIDEGYDKGAACSVGIGACLRAGEKKCDPNNATQTTCCVNDGNANGACTALMPGAPTPEICDGIDNDCNGLIDDGGVCQKAQCFPETCNGKDDDCDGVIDDHLIDEGRSCGLSLGICKPGTTACLNASNQDVTKGGAPDASDHLVCVGGVMPQPEVCNGLDDDCDGIVDGMSQACYDGKMGTDNVGICHDGLQACTAQLGSGVAAWGPCVGEVTPQTEVCNGLDDDCDGTVDDVMGAGATCCPSGKCGVGRCTAGTMQCSGGAIACVGGQGPVGEVCNGVDDDCDGKVDDLPSLGKPCTAANGCAGSLACDLVQMAVVCRSAQVSCGPTTCAKDPSVGKPCGPGVGLPLPCMAGALACTNDQITCVGGVGPSPEACNCVDDDCNGKVDDNAFCPSGTACVSCGCYANCGAGEFPCPGGYDCIDVNKKAACDNPGDPTCYCIPEQTCDPACGPDDTCTPQPPPATHGQCVSRCAGINCGAGYVCRRGACVSCVEDPTMCKACDAASATGERCDPVKHECVPDLCCGKECGDGLCQPYSGACTKSCVGVSCGPGQICQDGACGPDLCANVSCGEGQTCDPSSGGCVRDVCKTMTCSGPGEACCAGGCVEDPCALVRCAPGSKCTVRSLTCDVSCDQPLVPEVAQDRVVGAGGGGLAPGCHVATGGRSRGADPIGLLGVGIALVSLARRRRRLTR